MAVYAVHDDLAGIPSIALPADNLLGRAADRAGDHPVIGIENRRPPHIDDGRCVRRPEAPMEIAC
jgi:hypothetical protein